MASETQIFSREMILSAYKAALQLSRILYKSTLFMQNKANFRKSQMNVNLYNTTDYENKSNWTPGENKPNSKPNKANVKIGKMNISIATIKDYDNEQRTINNERYSKQSQNKANSKPI